MTAFVDTSALYVVVDGSDADHPLAKGVWGQLLADRATLMTSNYVLVETAALLQRQLGMEAWREFEMNVVPLLQVEWIDERRHQIGVETTLAVGRRKLSLVDGVSFRVMRDHGVGVVFCFDEHFREQGFEVLP